MSSRLLDALLGRQRSIENPERPLTDASLLDAFGSGNATDSGEAVSPRSALELVAVYRAVALLAGITGGLPLHAYQQDGARRRRVDVDVVESPHPEKTQMEVLEYIGQALYTHGNSYSWKVRDGAGRVREVWELDPSDVRVERRKAWRDDANPSGKRFHVKDGATEKTYTPYEILHIPGLSYDGVTGLSPLQLARQAIGLGIAAERFGARMFSRGALIQGVLETDQELEEPQASRLQKSWQSKTRGPDAQWKIPVLDSGAKFKAIALPPADAQFIEVRKFSIQEIARLFGLPPHLLGDVERSTSWGTGIEQQNMQMLAFTLDPWLVRIEQRITKELLPAGTYVKFQRAALLRADTAGRYLAYQRGANNGWLCADDIRAWEELDPLPDGLGQIFYRPGNLEPINPPDGQQEDPPEEDDDVQDEA